MQTPEDASENEIPAKAPVAEEQAEDSEDVQDDEYGPLRMRYHESKFARADAQSQIPSREDPQSQSKQEGTNQTADKSTFHWRSHLSSRRATNTK